MATPSVNRPSTRVPYPARVTERADDPYPGGRATPRQVLALADEYRAAATLLLGSCRRGEPASQAPFRLAALQAIELYLNAVLLHGGHEACSVRGLQHDLARRAGLAASAGLRLRDRTAAHLVALAADREYLLARYCPERRGPPPPNRLSATLDEVARKARPLVAPRIAGLPPQRPGRPGADRAKPLEPPSDRAVT